MLENFSLLKIMRCVLVKTQPPPCYSNYLHVRHIRFRRKVRRHSGKQRHHVDTRCLQNKNHGKIRIPSLTSDWSLLDSSYFSFIIIGFVIFAITIIMELTKITQLNLFKTDKIVQWLFVVSNLIVIINRSINTALKTCS